MSRQRSGQHSHILLAALMLIATGLLMIACSDSKRDVILATTTSIQDSGLLDALLPVFEERSGYSVKPIAVGSGEAMAMGRRGDADVLLVHAPEAERQFMAEGHGSDRRLVMHNDFVIVGPPDDPASLRGLTSTADALRQLAQHESLFLSRGDNSGTHQREKQLWQASGIDPQGARWYQESGQGMGETLTIAAQKGAYTLTDRATFLTLRDKIRLEVLVDGDAALLNVYHVVQVNPDKSRRINVAGARAFVEFMVSPEAQRIIGEFGRDRFGQPLFYADAGKSEADLVGR